MNRTTKISICFLISFLFIKCSSFYNKKSATYRENKEHNLYIFIGEKIDIETISSSKHKGIKFIECTQRDTLYRRYQPYEDEFKMRYKILKNIYNNIGKDSVTFQVRKPIYQDHKKVILYLSRGIDGFYYNPNSEYDEIKEFNIKNRSDVNYLQKRIKYIDSLICRAY